MRLPTNRNLIRDHVTLSLKTTPPGPLWARDCCFWAIHCSLVLFSLGSSISFKCIWILREAGVTTAQSIAECGWELGKGRALCFMDDQG